MAAGMTSAQETTPLMKKAKLCNRLANSIMLTIRSGAGLLADGYDLLVIDLVISDIAHLHPDAMGPKAKSFVVSMTLVGVIIGQLSFGSLVDIVGTKVASMATAALITVGALVSACCQDFSGFSLATQLGLCRFFLGFGIGGEYPVSASLGVEGHSTMAGAHGDAFCGSRAQLQVMIAGMFNVGALLTSLVVLVLLKAGMPLDMVWRVCLGLGALPAFVAFIARATSPSPAQRIRVGCNDRGVGYLQRFLRTVGPRKDILLGACLSWGIFNFTVYGQSSFRSTISDRIYGNPVGTSVHSTLYRNAFFSMTMGMCACAGTGLGIAVIDRLRRSKLQLVGFAGAAISMWVCGGLLGALSSDSHLPLVLCNWVWVVVNIQIGITTYLIPAEFFPFSVRATCFGMAAASGKLGALISTSLFPICEASFGLQIVLITSGFVSLAGVIVTLLFTPHSDPDPALLDALEARENDATAKL